ncbi:MAG: hypothetical protein GC160_27650 [Acidobacteria bacterium]|nr:hypothetical protein [Acidobacteriota bacterium]
MSKQTFHKTFLLAALALGLTTLGVAKTPAMCVVGPVSPESYTWDFKAEGAQLLADAETHARRIKRYAADLEAFSRVPEEPSWESHATNLELIRLEVNALGADACRMSRIGRVVDPEEHAQMNRVEARAEALSALTKKAIAQFNDWPQRETLRPSYARLVHEIYSQARELKRAAETPNGGHELGD